MYNAITQSPQKELCMEVTQHEVLNLQCETSKIPYWH